MQKALTEYDEQLAIRCEKDDCHEELVLSYHVDFAFLPTDLRDRVNELLHNALKKTGEKHLRDANNQQTTISTV